MKIELKEEFKEMSLLGILKDTFRYYMEDPERLGVKHLLSTRVQGCSYYVNKKGKDVCCAIGRLIPLEQAKFLEENGENQDIGYIVEINNSIEKDKFFKDNIYALSDLQHVHDDLLTVLATEDDPFVIREYVFQDWHLKELLRRITGEKSNNKILNELYQICLKNKKIKQ